MRAANPVPILYLIDKLHRAGAQNNLSQLALGIDRDRFAPSVCCLTRGGPVADDIERAGVEVTVLGIGRIYTPHAWHALRRLAEMMRERKVRLVQSYMASSNLLGTLAARMAEVPVALTTRRDMGFSRNWRLRWLEETFINPKVSRVVVPCEAIAEVTRRERHLEPAKIVTIPNGIDTKLWQWDERERQEGREGLGLTRDDRAVGVIANFLPVKGHADFLEAAAVVLAARRPTKIFLAGDGEIRGQIEAMAARLGLSDRVSFLGRRNDTRELLAALDLCVLPSRSEGMSNVLLEAMAMERPVVATAVGGNTELVEHGVTGLLVPPRDPKALASAMLTLLMDPELASRMGREARRVVESRYSLGDMVTRYEALYDSLVVPGAAP